MKPRGQTESLRTLANGLDSVPGKHTPVWVVWHSEQSVTRFNWTQAHSNPALEQTQCSETFGRHCGLSSPASRGMRQAIRIRVRTQAQALRPDCRETSLRLEPPCNPNRRT